MKLLICSKFRQRIIERVMDLTDSFMWEDLATRLSDTGQLTSAEWIPFIKTYTSNEALVCLNFRCVQSKICVLKVVKQY